LVIREQLLSGTYEPQLEKRVEIPKPDGGMRKLGIPRGVNELRAVPLPLGERGATASGLARRG